MYSPILRPLQPVPTAPPQGARRGDTHPSSLAGCPVLSTAPALAFTSITPTLGRPAGSLRRRRSFILAPTALPRLRRCWLPAGREGCGGAPATVGTCCGRGVGAVLALAFSNMLWSTGREKGTEWGCEPGWRGDPSRDGTSQSCPPAPNPAAWEHNLGDRAATPAAPQRLWAAGECQGCTGQRMHWGQHGARQGSSEPRAPRWHCQCTESVSYLTPSDLGSRLWKERKKERERIYQGNSKGTAGMSLPRCRARCAADPHPDLPCCLRRRDSRGALINQAAVKQ